MFPPDTPKPIQGAQAWQDELQTAAIWDRPPRQYHTDTPIYPWVPRPNPEIRVSFKLGWQ